MQLTVFEVCSVLTQRKFKFGLSFPIFFDFHIEYTVTKKYTVTV